MCILLTVAGKRRSATARGWKVKMAMFGRFLLFSASTSIKGSPSLSKAENCGNRPSAGRPSLGAKAKLCELCVLCGSRRQHCRTVPPQSLPGLKAAASAKRKLRATSPPAGERRALCCKNGCERPVMEAADQSLTTLCGLRTCFGSKTSLMPRISAWIGSESDWARKGFFAKPMPCSPETCPFSSRALP